MAINAYKIQKTIEVPTFNLWHDRLLMQLITETTSLDQINKIGIGIITITKEDLEMIKTGLIAKQGEYDEEEYKYTQKKIEKIEKDIGNKEEVEYICKR